MVVIMVRFIRVCKGLWQELAKFYHGKMQPAPDQVCLRCVNQTGGIIVGKDSGRGFAMAKFAIGERVEKAADHEDGVVIAVFPTEDGKFRYAVDMEGYGALQFFTEEKLVVHVN